MQEWVQKPITTRSSLFSCQTTIQVGIVRLPTTTSSCLLLSCYITLHLFYYQLLFLVLVLLLLTMVASSTDFLLSFIFLFFLLVEGGDIGWFRESKVLKFKELPWKEKAHWKKWCSLPQKSRREKGATILEMRHHGPCSGSTRSMGKNKMQQLILSDESRIQYLQSKTKNSSPQLNSIENNSSGAQIPLTSGVKLQTLNYIVTVKLGGRKTTVIVDTGSDLTWVQCIPCTYCYNQQEPIFDPSVSPSYQPVPCSSPTCTYMLQSTGNFGICRATSNPTCKYALSYGDGSYSRGELARDRIDLAGTVIENFLFGCGRSNRGLFGGASGLMGLGRSQLSLISQTTNQFGGIFSYCLPSREFDSSGSLVLGGDSSVFKNTTPIFYTRAVSNSQFSPFYLLNLTGMSVGGEELQASGFSNGRILIDSGTVITRLVPSVYRALKSEFLNQFSSYPSAPAFSILDTCFNLSGHQQVNVPTLKFRFEGEAEMTVDVTGVLYFVKPDASQVCLAMTGLSDEGQLGIIGNYQQKNLRIVYDTLGSKVGFAPEACSYI